MKKTRWLKTIGTIAIIGFIGVPVAITTVSCSNGSTQEPNNGKLPNQVLTADTSHITSFEEAIKFANEYLNKNYNFAMFKKDLEDYINLLSSDKRFGLTDITQITSNIDKTINFVWVQSSGNDYIYVYECKNFPITPVLLLTNQNQLSLGFYLSWPTQPRFDIETNLDMTGDKIVGAKNNLVGYKNNIVQGNLGWTKTLNPTIDQQKIYTNNYVIPVEISCKCFLSSTINLKFDNINDINENLYQK